MGKCQSDVESDEVDRRHMAKWGYERQVDSTFSSRVPRTIQIIKKVDKIQFSQASTSSSVLTTLDICQHDEKSFVSITEFQKL